ncbi:efflux RND transporter periplasmic adaptor subunit [Roseospira visakhapatnamensis]|uniref:RND family efflux transporter MFP subunit n=1 Tax=Roseospira visakhapatnamensis TaxID=390880 RepID=A0A7W6REJ5_9PROT|nr:efflux RND transporter periplasmic adaptor subunit [Roseospira visakhapatnamensis]MBB4267085.1 RND family efflux transporter MFP subunit [Roseospira visakhapatnamensis]
MSPVVPSPPSRRAPSGRCLVLGLLGPMLAACTEPAPEIAVVPRPIAWTEVRVATGTESRPLSGVVRSVQRAPLSFEVPGRVAALTVDVGDHIEAGAVLGRLDQRTYRLTRQERASEVVQAEAAVREATQEHARQQKLHAQGWAPEAALDSARAALETARGWLETARARLDIAEESLADTVLRAPYDGLVAHRRVEPAQQVTAGETVLEVLGNGGGFEIAMAVPETLVDSLTPGDIHQVTFPARPGVVAAGRVTEIGTEAGRGGAFPVTLRLVAPRAGLRAGLTAEVAVVLPGPRAAAAGESAGDQAGAPPVVIPVTAFLAGDGADSVAFVFKPDDEAGLTGILERRAVTLGPVETDRALVTAGLSPGEIIATRGLPFLRAGQAVSRLGVGPARYE